MVKLYTKDDFKAWLALQGDRTFNGSDPCACAMTQFGMAVDPRTKASHLCGSIDGKIADAVLYDDPHNNNESHVIGRIELSNEEVISVCNAKTFQEVLKVLS